MTEISEWVSSSGWLGITAMIAFWFGVIVLVVWLTGSASRLLRSITVIKSVHTVVFFLLSGLLGIFVYEVMVNRISFFTWTAVTLFLAEGVILVANNGRCPLTAYAEQLGSSHGQITDIFCQSGSRIACLSYIPVCSSAACCFWCSDCCDEKRDKS